MPRAHDLVASAARFLREPYSTLGGRCSPTSGYKDCSGLCSAGLNGIGLFGGCGNSTGLEIWARNNGGFYVSRDWAMNHEGVLCCIWGYDRYGHIGISAGFGNTIETPSAWGHCVGISPMDHDRWGEFITVPGLDYSNPAPKPVPEVIDVDKYEHDVIVSAMNAAQTCQTLLQNGEALTQWQRDQLTTTVECGQTSVAFLAALYSIESQRAQKEGLDVPVMDMPAVRELVARHAGVEPPAPAG